jgi:hypothetical protein
MDAMEVLLLIGQVEARQVPCGVVGESGSVDHQRDEIGLEMRVSDVGVIEVAMEGILISRTSRICDFQLGLSLYSVVI